MNPHGHGGIMATCAVSYCLGRRTYIVAECADWLIAIWDQLPASARAIIKRDVERQFSIDDSARQGVALGLPPNMTNISYPLGADCDREQWERVRKLWQ